MTVARSILIGMIVVPVLVVGAGAFLGATGGFGCCGKSPASAHGPLFGALYGAEMFGFAFGPPAMALGAVAGPLVQLMFGPPGGVKSRPDDFAE